MAGQTLAQIGLETGEIDEAAGAVLQAEEATIESLARCTLRQEADPAKLESPAKHFKNAAVFVTPGVRAAVPDVIDTEKERDRLQRDLKKLEKELGAVEKKLSNPGFVNKAPEAVVQKEREKLVEAEKALANLQGQLEKIRKL